MYAPQLGYFCLRLVRQEDAEEIVQETFIKLWETRDKIKVELNFNTYITTIAKNLIYDMFRKKLVEQRYYQKFQSLIQEQLAVENELFRKNLQEVMFDSINKLSEQQREVMMLKCKGFNNDEIAGAEVQQPLFYILAPLAVVPSCQKQGVGGLLIAEGLQLLRERGAKLVFVLGHKEYYPRHGFIPGAEKLGFPAPYPILEKHADYWMAQALTDDGFSGPKGRVVCADALNRPEHWRE